MGEDCGGGRFLKSGVGAEGGEEVCEEGAVNGWHCGEGSCGVWGFCV